ncbi:GT2 family glycosyltransferase [Pseudomonas protegens]|uniref:glycosyltransferase n=1 Tax=Pseudomonas TaxID=286 RepID=UPI000F4914B7|nr:MULTISPECIES: glycosyltransferase [Pseudomonas]MCS4260642.1 glycosyltransferase involved in cell wall biosynthesis [Pseudomonas sp. BIGb0176]MDF4208012.1 glycosyltransferase [Pseudomonas protegens]MDT3419214.1 glycosyltransferase involved in cell wall biosynthesis [Pseudomonas protegens]ROM21335.1 glycosyl transferase family 2 [Pseudomonas protegens]ROQ61790.1 GT2 family glycosyltransferase [Pseudomonas protegens]
MSQAPLVSIVIPAFNPRFFSQALESALAQTYQPLEIVVCDDSPGDEIQQVVQGLSEPAHPVRYVRNPQPLGLQKNLLRCVKEARGELIKVLCDDDRLFAPSIALQAQVLIEHPEVNLVFALRVFNDEGNSILPPRIENCRFAPLDVLLKGDDMLAIFEGTRKNFLGNFSAALMRRADVLEVLPALIHKGAGFVALLDLALFICLMRRGNLAALSTVLSCERLYQGRFSRTPQVLKAVATEWEWLLRMLSERSGESAPAAGWVRYVELARAAEQPRPWRELGVLHVLGNRSAVVNGRVGGESQSYEEFYQQWLAARCLSAAEQRLLPQRIESWPRRVRIVPIVMDLAGDGAALERTLGSLAGQLYPAETIVVLSTAAGTAGEAVLRQPLRADWAGQLNELIPRLDTCDWFYLLQSGDQLRDTALLVLAERIANTPAMLCAYSDEGALLDGQSTEPVFKPDFNLDLMRAYPYVGRSLAFSRERFLSEGGFDCARGELAPQDLLWRLVENVGPQTIEHIADIQIESEFPFAKWLSRPQVIEASEGLVAAHLQRIGVQCRIRHDDLPLLNRIDYQHGARPLVSIIITCGDSLPALQRCVEGLIEQTAYNHYEILLVAAGSRDPDMADWLAAMGQLGGNMLRVLPYAGPANQAALTNSIAAQARGDYLLLLSHDTRICTSDWLDELLNQAQRPEVAVVGARILATDGSILHAGQVLGMSGPVGSPFIGEALGARGYMQRLQVVQNWSAVSRDCLMIRKDVFDSLGGLDEQSFGADLGEADLCLRVDRDGYLVVWTPHATLMLAPALAPPQAPEQQQMQEAEQERFYRQWLPKIARDPAYNPALSLGFSSFSLEPSLRNNWNPFCSRALPLVLGLPVNSSAVGHYRVTGPLRELEAAGRVIARVAYESPTTVEIERLSPDTIVLQGRYSDGAASDILRMKKYSSALRVFELDDYVVSAPKKNSHARNKPANIEQMLRDGIALCDRLVVTTQPLADVLSDMHSDIRVVPNMLAPEPWAGLSSRRGTSSKPRVGWGGGTSHTGDLEVIADVVRELASEVEWVFFGMCPDALRPYVHEFHPAIGLQAYPLKLASLNLDLALAPLEFHIFNDCKSNLRLLEYGACGYPVICTDTEAYRGFLPCTRVRSNTTEEWLQAIRMHLSDPVASYRMGDELREAVRRDFMLGPDNLQHWMWGWLAD